MATHNAEAELFTGIDFVVPTTTTVTTMAQPSASNPMGNQLPRLSVRKNKKIQKASVSEKNKSHIRGVGTLRKLSEFVKDHGRIPLTWDINSNSPHYPNKIKQSLSWDIGTIVRSHVPMTKPHYGLHDEETKNIIINQLSVYYDIDHQSDDLYRHIQTVAATIYRQHKYRCYKVFQEQKSIFPVPEEFEGKEREWKLLCEYFATPEFMKKSNDMTKSRNSTNKKNHKAGPKSFVIKAQEFVNKPAPLMHAYSNAYKETDSDRSKLAEELVQKTVTEMCVEQSTDNVGESLEPVDVHIPIERQIELMEEIVGPSKGTRLRGFGSVKVKLPKVRGPAIATPPQDSSLKEEFAVLKEKFENTQRELAELKEKMNSNESV